MNEKIDLTKILKDCPKGTEFYSRCLGVVKFDSIDDTLKRIIVKNQFETVYYYKNGVYYYADENAEIDLFPSKDQRDWSKWQRPFIDGDVVYNILQDTIGIVMYDKNDFPCKICDISNNGLLWYDEGSLIAIVERNYRFATEEEKQRLFDAIESNGYKWNNITKTLEKLIIPKFKVGDIIQNKNNYKVKITEVNIEDELYGYESLIANGIGGISFNEQDSWELVPNKFDISTLKPFDKVLVRTHPDNNWFATFFSHINHPATFYYKFATTSGISYKYMIPYNEETKHLLGTNKQAPEFYIY